MEPEYRFCTSTDGTRIAYAIWGDGPPLLFVQAWSASIAHHTSAWVGEWVDRLAARRTFAIMDRRGTGASQRDVKDLSLEAQLADIEAVMDHAGSRAFDVFSVSDGAAICLAFAARRPDRVTRLVLWCPWAASEQIGGSSTLTAMAELMQRNARLGIRAYADLVLPGGMPGELRQYRRDIQRDTAAELWSLHFHFMAALDVRADLPKVRAPTLVVHRRGALGVPLEAGRSVAAMVPNARLMVVEGNMAHQALGDQSYVDSVIRFLDEVRAPIEGTELPSHTAPEPRRTGATMRTAAAPERSFASGRYVVRRVLGEGGQKVVYLVHDTALDRECALSVIKSDLLDAEDLLRLRREAQAMARLGAHSNIVTVHDFGEEDGKPYLVCEYVPGGDLRTELRDAGGSLRIERALAIAMDIARALAVAHARGVIHRDLKPANVWLCNDGSAKLGDFGLAFSLDRSRLTMAGIVMGTAAYMAPEQALAQPVTERSDLYSLGALLYEMACGRPPFTDENATALIAQHINAQPVAPSESNQDLPPALDALIMRLLAKAPEKRPESATEALAALAAIAEAHEAAAHEEAPAVRTPGGTEQEIRFCSARDGVRLAYATAGSGFPLVKAANWLSHLEFDWQSPIWGHLLRALADVHQLIRYDERGTGLSDREVMHMSFEDWTNDLETVVDAAGLDRFALLGISQGGPVAISYAAQHPERVSQLILYGTFARLPKRPPAETQALVTLMRQGWGRTSAVYRQLFTSSFIPDATAEQMRWFNELESRSASPETAVTILMGIRSIDVADMAARITVPTLILHCHGDQAVPFSAGRELAALVPAARFVPMEGSNHYFLEHEPAREVFLRELRAFLGDVPREPDPRTTTR